MIKAGFIFPGSVHTSTTSECFIETAVHQRVAWSGDHQSWIIVWCLSQASVQCTKTGKPWGTHRKKESVGLCGRSEQVSIFQLSLLKDWEVSRSQQRWWRGRNNVLWNLTAWSVQLPKLHKVTSFLVCLLFFSLEIPSSGRCICFMSSLRAAVNTEGSEVAPGSSSWHNLALWPFSC